jgi:Ca2+-binding EF-hand superfamily protein
VEQFREIFAQDVDAESKKIAGHHLLTVLQRAFQKRLRDDEVRQFNEMVSSCSEARDHELDFAEFLKLMRMILNTEIFGSVSRSSTPPPQPARMNATQVTIKE